MTLIVRSLTMDDAAAAGRIHNETWRETYRGESSVAGLCEARSWLCCSEYLPLLHD
jgi:hypothetical protein